MQPPRRGVQPQTVGNRQRVFFVRAAGWGAGVASDRLGQRGGVEGLFQQGGKEHAGFGLLADLFGIGA